MDSLQIQSLIKRKTDGDTTTYALETFRAAMLTFDIDKFETTLDGLLKEKNFSEIYSQVFVPLLTNAGLLWQTGTMEPSHEHFISQKIKHALIVQTAVVKNTAVAKDSPDFVLYLPPGELHEIG